MPMSASSEEKLVLSTYVCKATDIQDHQRSKGTSTLPIGIIVEVLECIDELKAEYGDDW